jgi:hypothetical protein
MEFKFEQIQRERFYADIGCIGGAVCMWLGHFAPAPDWLTSDLLEFGTYLFALSGLVWSLTDPTDR